MEPFCDACEDDRELDCTIHLFKYGVNSLGAGWIGPISTTLIIRSLYVGVANPREPLSLVESRRVKP
jgi:hypothetical protein